MRRCCMSVAFHKGRKNRRIHFISDWILYFIFVYCSYYSDTSDLTLGRNQNEHLSVSPIPQIQNSISEVDAINNNRNMESNLPRKSGLLTCSNQCKSEAQQKISPGKRLISDRDQSATSIPVDTRLNDWLNSSNIDPISKTAILSEHFTYDDFIYGMEKTDLQRIGLK